MSIDTHTLTHAYTHTHLNTHTHTHTRIHTHTHTHTQENIRTHVPQISSLNAEIAFQDRTKRNVRDNIDVRETERELVRLEKALKEMEGKEGGGAGALRDAQR